MVVLILPEKGKLISKLVTAASGPAMICIVGNVTPTPSGSGMRTTNPCGISLAGNDVVPRRPLASLADRVMVGGVVAGLVAAATTSTRAVMLPFSGHSRAPTATPEASVTGWSGAVAPNTPALTPWTTALSRGASGGMVAVDQPSHTAR